MSKTFSAALSIVALLLFTVAGLLASAPSLRPGAAPSAGEVRRARGAALELAVALAADGAPRRVQLSRGDLEAAATLVGHGLDWVRVEPSIEGERFVARANLKLADRTWLDVGARAAAGAAAFPDIELRVGAWRLPPTVVRVGLRAADRLVRWRGYALPPTTSMIRDLAIRNEGVAATFAVPRGLFRFARDLVGSRRPPIDPMLVESAYRRLAAARLGADGALASALKPAFAGPAAGASAADRNRAAFVALAMYVVSPSAQRLAGSELAIEPVGDVPSVRLGGRHDLAKHFVLSAALAATLDPGFTRAIGEWKELDDSLPGGSGFSFVDLTADRAGLHLARAAIDPSTAERVAADLAEAGDADLFPSAAHRLAEGLTDAEFSRSYGSLDAASYARAVRRVDQLLARLPLYASYIR